MPPDIALLLALVTDHAGQTLVSHASLLLGSYSRVAKLSHPHRKVHPLLLTPPSEDQNGSPEVDEGRRMQYLPSHKDTAENGSPKFQMFQANEVLETLIKILNNHSSPLLAASVLQQENSPKVLCTHRRFK